MRRYRRLAWVTVLGVLACGLTAPAAADGVSFAIGAHFVVGGASFHVAYAAPGGVGAPYYYRTAEPIRYSGHECSTHCLASDGYWYHVPACPLISHHFARFGYHGPYPEPYGYGGARHPVGFAWGGYVGAPYWGVPYGVHWSFGHGYGGYGYKGYGYGGYGYKGYGYGYGYRYGYPRYGRYKGYPSYGGYKGYRGHRGYGHRGYGHRGYGYKGYGYKGHGYKGGGYKGGYGGSRHAPGAARRTRPPRHD